MFDTRFDERGLTSKTFSSFFWRFGEKCVQYIVQLAIQILLARLLDPEAFGVYAVLYGLITVLGILMQGGLITSLIRDPDAEDGNFVAVLLFNLVFASILYTMLFVSAPKLAGFFRMPDLAMPLRVAGLSLFLSAYVAVQTGKLMRSMDFKLIFLRTFGAVVFSGVCGVAAAFAGLGVWALVIQQLANQLFCCAVLGAISPLRCRPKMSFYKMRMLLRFGWKLCLSSLIKGGYDSILDLLLGKSLGAFDLGLYNRGRKFAQVACTALDDPMQNVLLPAFSKRQHDPTALREALKTSVDVYSFIAAPVLACAIYYAEPLIVLLLTDKWLAAVPYFQICCFSYLMLPILTPSLQAFNAVGRSGIGLFVEVLRLAFSISVLLVAFASGFSPLSQIIAVSVASVAVSTSVFGFNQKFMGYALIEQFRSFGGPYVISFVLLVGVWAFEELLGSILGSLGGAWSLVTIIVFVVLYGAVSLIVRPRGWKAMCGILRVVRGE